jgi:hypothetical protein
LVRAHAIPEAFFDIPPQASGAHLKLMTNKAGVHPKRAPIGIYDNGILCGECEGNFSDVDGYGAKVLLNEVSAFIARPDEGDPEYFVLPHYDYDLLKRFFMAVLWRAAVSMHEFYARIRLGPFEPTLLSMLKTGNPGRPDDFGVMLWTYDAHPNATITFDPFATRVGDIHCYRFKLYRYVFWIKVDKRPYLRDIRELQLSPGSPLVVLHQAFAESQDHKLARALVRGEAARRKLDVL